MITTDPKTWNNFEDHPSFKEYSFNSNWKDWYAGESIEIDLALLKGCANELVCTLDNIIVDLRVLDDLTVFVQVQYGSAIGEYGIGCENNTLYLHLDTNPNDPEAEEFERDNLIISELVELVERSVDVKENGDTR